MIISYTYVKFTLILNSGLFHFTGLFFLLNPSIHSNKRGYLPVLVLYTTGLPHIANASRTFFPAVSRCYCHIMQTIYNKSCTTFTRAYYFFYRLTITTNNILYNFTLLLKV